MTVDPKYIAMASALCAELRANGSPMRGMHLGERQDGTVFWERDGWPFVKYMIAQALAKAAEEALKPSPELAGKVPLVLFFATKADADEFVEVFKQVKPNVVSRSVP